VVGKLGGDAERPENTQEEEEVLPFASFSAPGTAASLRGAGQAPGSAPAHTRRAAARRPRLPAPVAWRGHPEERAFDRGASASDFNSEARNRLWPESTQHRPRVQVTASESRLVLRGFLQEK